MSKKNNLKKIELVESKPVSIKKNANEIVPKQLPKFYVSDETFFNSKDILREVKKAIFDLPENKSLIISNENTGMTINELRKKITNVIVCHKSKNIEKEFSTSKIDDLTLRITRSKNKTTN